MGRQVRRVPMDFDWPIDKVWEGFLTPDRLQENPCPDCYRVKYKGEHQYGSGSTPAQMWLDGWLHLLGMMAEDISDQARDDGVPVTQRITGAGGTERMHPYLQDLQKICIYEHRRPSADITELVGGLLGERGRVSFGYSTDVAMKVSTALKEAAGVPVDWGICPTCQGHGAVEAYPGQRGEAEAWAEEDHEPPAGDGWQLWETVSEGSPISPVFETADDLARWMSSDAYQWGISRPMPYAAALRFVTGAGWAPSMVATSGRLIPGEQFIGEVGL